MIEDNLIAKAAQKLRSGELVIFPTETVYGIGAAAGSDSACNKIYEVKGRPSNNPLIIHVARLEQALEIGHFNEHALKLALKFWPGPLTIVVKIKDKSLISNTATAGLGTVAIRIPSNQVALKLLEACGGPVAAPSANPSGYISATSYDHIKSHAIFNNITMLDGGSSAIGLESTIIDMSGEKYTLLRAGFISAELIEQVISMPVSYSVHDSNQYIIAPGMMLKHYSPKAKLRLNASKENLEHDEILIGFGSTREASFNLSITGDLNEAAKNLYSMLRAADELASIKGFTIAAVNIPSIAIGIAINDRLKRAAIS